MRVAAPPLIVTIEPEKNGMTVVPSVVPSLVKNAECAPATSVFPAGESQTAKPY